MSPEHQEYSRIISDQLIHQLLTAQLSPPAVRPVVLQIEIFLQKFIEQTFSTDGPTVNGMLKSCRYKTS